jgi:surface protein
MINSKICRDTERSEPQKMQLVIIAIAIVAISLTPSEGAENHAVNKALLSQQVANHLARAGGSGRFRGAGVGASGGLSDLTIRTAVHNWCTGGDPQKNAENAYGKIQDWDVSRVTNMAGLFRDQSTCNPPIGNWNTANVTSMYAMFYKASAFNQPIGNWNTTMVTRMDFMFFQASAFNQPIGNWNTAAVTRMASMFWEASAFNQPIGNWNTAKVTSMGYMFYEARAFNQKLCWTLPSEDRMFFDMFSGSGCNLCCFSPPGTCA